MSGLAYSRLLLELQDLVKLINYLLKFKLFTIAHSLSHAHLAAENYFAVDAF